jgi:hypothetical protein
VCLFSKCTFNIKINFIIVVSDDIQIRLSTKYWYIYRLQVFHFSMEMPKPLNNTNNRYQTIPPAVHGVQQCASTTKCSYRNTECTFYSIKQLHVPISYYISQFMYLPSKHDSKSLLQYTLQEKLGELFTPKGQIIF